MNYLLLIILTSIVTILVFERVSIRPLLNLNKDMLDFESYLIERMEQALIDRTHERDLRTNAEEELTRLRAENTELEAENKQLKSELAEQLEEQTKEA